MRKLEFTRVVAIRNMKLTKGASNAAIYDCDVIEHDNRKLLRQPLVDYLNKLGREGWEIKASDSSENAFTVILQREVES